MELNLNTIRSLDANKTYYIANSTGQIKEAGAWQKFKCFLGVGDARDKVQKPLSWRARRNTTRESSTPRVSEAKGKCP